MLKILSLTLVLSALGLGASTAAEVKKRAEALKTYLDSEKQYFESRESQKKDLLSALDTLNADQNRVRERVLTLSSNQTELSMALENLSLEYQRQKQVEQLQRTRLALLLKVVYKIKKEGMFRFVFFGHNLGELTSRVRVLYRTLRSQRDLTRQMQERTNRLIESEKKLSQARTDLARLINELHDQEQLLSGLHRKRKQLLTSINQKQGAYQAALKEFQRVTKRLNTLFRELPSAKEVKPPAPTEAPLLAKASLPLPVSGRITQGFGKSVHEKFGTVTYHKGLEIEAEFNSPVAAVLPGTVEYAGWLKGLGNVMIVHHGQGIYSLNAHLFKNAKELGSKVEGGETIGFVGDTGNNEKPSLYFELREGGKAVDPVPYFAKSSALN